MTARTRPLPPEVAALLTPLTPEVRALVTSLRAFVLATLPRADEIADPAARVIGYGYGPGYKGMVASIILSKSGAKLGLVRGASLPDPTRLLEGRGKVHRYIAFAPGETVARAEVKALVRAALAAWEARQ